MTTQTLKSADPEFLKKVFTHQLNRIYNAKCFLHKTLPNLVSLASFKGLELAMEEFAGDVYKQIERMRLIFAALNESPVEEEHNPILNIVKDKFFLDETQAIPLLNDLDLILYVQLLEHVNITSYRMLIMVAKLLKYDHVKQLLQESYDESQANDKLFTLIAKEYITKD